MTKVAGISEMVEGDAAVGGTSSSSNPKGSTPTPSRLTDSDPKIRPRNANRTGRYHLATRFANLSMRRSAWTHCRAHGVATVGTQSINVIVA